MNNNRLSTMKELIRRYKVPVGSRERMSRQYQLIKNAVPQLLINILQGTKNPTVEFEGRENQQQQQSYHIVT